MCFLSNHISVVWKSNNTIQSEAIVYIPDEYTHVKADNTAIFDSNYVENKIADSVGKVVDYNRLRLGSGSYQIISEL